MKIKIKSVLLLVFLSGALVLFTLQKSFANPITLAIIPFENLSGNKNLNYLGIGFAETLSTQLSQIENVEVIERTQIDKILKEQSLQNSGFTDAETTSQLGKLLNANFLVVGSFQKIEKNVLASVRIIDVATGKIVKGKSFQVQGKFDEFFTIQQELANKLLTSFNIKPSSEIKKVLQNKPTKSLSAYEYLMKGIELFDKGTQKAKQEALQLWEKAKNLDEKVGELIWSAYYRSGKTKENEITGVIIDCGNYNLERSQSPLVYSQSKKIIYGRFDKYDEFMQMVGIVSYSSNLQQAKKRTGKNPLIIKAVAVKDINGFPTSPMISNSDAQKIITANKKWNFLSKYRVAFITK